MYNEEGEKMISLIMWMGAFIGICMNYFTYVKYKKNDLSFKSYLLWFSVWTGLVITSVFPSLLKYVSEEVFNIQRPVDFVYICVSLFLLIVIFFIFAAMKNLTNKIETVVSEVAIINVIKGKKK